MKQQINQYFACQEEGYVKYENVQVPGSLSVRKQVPVSAKCNEVLPYKVHKIQVKQPIVITNSKPQLFSTEKSQSQSKSTSCFYLSQIYNPERILQKDQVNSIYLDEKRSTRVKTQQKGSNLTKSSITNVKKSKPQMKKSLFETNSTSLTNNNFGQYNYQIQTIISTLREEKMRRIQMEQKYQKLYKIITKSHKQKHFLNETQNDGENIQISKKFQRNESLQKSDKKTNVTKSKTQIQFDSQSQYPLIFQYGQRNQRKRSLQPIIIRLDNCSNRLEQKERRSKTIKLQNNQYQEKQQQPQYFQKQQFLEIIRELKQQISNVNQNVDYLENKLQQQQEKYQKQLLLNQIKEKQRKIQEISKQNQKIKQINQLYLQKQIQINSDSKDQQFTINGKKINTITTFFFSFLLFIGILNIGKNIC